MWSEAKSGGKLFSASILKDLPDKWSLSNWKLPVFSKEDIAIPDKCTRALQMAILIPLELKRSKLIASLKHNKPSENPKNYGLIIWLFLA